MWIDEDSEFMNISSGLRDKDILEVGCGDGRLSIRFAGIANTLVALDPDEEKLRKARKRLSSQDATVRFEVGRGEKLTFPGESFDAVFYSLSFHHLPIESQYDAILEAKRVLRHNGKLLIYEPIANGQVQSLFLIFEKELDQLMEVSRTVNKAETEGIFQTIKIKNFSITWKFEESYELLDFFKKEYGDNMVNEKKHEVFELLKGQISSKPIILEDKLKLMELDVRE